MPGNSDVMQALRSVPRQARKLRKADFTLSNGTANQKTEIARYTAPRPLAFREDKGMRLAVAVVEEFTTDTTGGNAETFNLSQNIIQSKATSDYVLYDEGTQVDPDSVDFDANTFTYSNPDASADTLDFFYIARDPGLLEIWKEAPKSSGDVRQKVFDDATSTLHELNQQKTPPDMDFRGESELKPVVPTDWDVVVYADLPYAAAWDDSDTATDNGVKAVIPMLSIPVHQTSKNVPGLGRAVFMDIADSA